MHLKNIPLLFTVVATLSGTVNPTYAGLFSCCFGTEDKEEALTRPINATTPLLPPVDDRSVALPATRYVKTISLAEETHVGTLISHINSAAASGQLTLSTYGTNALKLDLPLSDSQDAVLIIHGLGLHEIQRGAVTPIEVQFFSGSDLSGSLTEEATRQQLAANPLKMLNTQAKQGLQASPGGMALQTQFEKTFSSLLKLEGRMYAISKDGMRAVRFEIINWGCIDFCSGLKAQSDIKAVCELMDQTGLPEITFK